MKYQAEKPTRRWRRIANSSLVLVAGLFLFISGVALGSTKLTQKSAGNQKGNLDYASVEEVYQEINDKFDGTVDKAKLLDGLKEGLAKATGDDYTEYLNTESAKTFNEELNGSFSGIGAELGKDKNAVVIIAPIAGFPAEKAGLKSKDIITKIDDASAIDLNVSEAVNKIRGPVGTSVKLTIIRGGVEELEFTVVRQTITIPSVESKILDGSIGYLKISRFGPDTTQLAAEAAKSFKNQSVKGVIVDIRNDPGGLLEAAVNVASLWLPEGKTVLTERRGENIIHTYFSRGSSPLNKVPTVVITNEGSASASEILAGALKDNGAATLLGVKTYGKGSVQQLSELKNGGVLKVTSARWFTPSGKNIDKAGIEPDKKVERTDDDIKANRDPQLDAAQETLKAPSN